jgi:hypothetical protein
MKGQSPPTTRQTGMAVVLSSVHPTAFLKRATSKQTNDNREEISGGRHVVRTRSWWKQGDVDACAAQTNMQYWVHQDTILNGEQAENNLRESWEHESSKDEMNIVL